MKTLPVEYLRECLDYDPETGAFRWRRRPREHFVTERAWKVTNTRCAGKPAGHLDKASGYIVIGISHCGRWRLYQAHRLAIALADGEWPDGEVDHVNRDKAYNPRANLRVCSHIENIRNQGKRAAGKNRLKGAYYHKRIGRWQATICANYRQIHLGYFDEEAAAHAAYCAASVEHHGSFGSAG